MEVVTFGNRRRITLCCGDLIAYTISPIYGVGGFFDNAFDGDNSACSDVFDYITATNLGELYAVCLNLEVSAFFIVAIKGHDKVEVVTFDNRRRITICCSNLIAGAIGPSYIISILSDNAINGDSHILCYVFNNVYATIVLKFNTISVNLEVSSFFVVSVNTYNKSEFVTFNNGIFVITGSSYNRITFASSGECNLKVSGNLNRGYADRDVRGNPRCRNGKSSGSFIESPTDNRSATCSVLHNKIGIVDFVSVIRIELNGVSRSNLCYCNTIMICVLHIEGYIPCNTNRHYSDNNSALDGGSVDRHLASSFVITIVCTCNKFSTANCNCNTVGKFEIRISGQSCGVILAFGSCSISA